jgi:hypothetical protein
MEKAWGPFKAIFISKHSVLGIRLVRKSKVQYSKIAIYWAPLTVGFSILWSVALNLFGLSGSIPALSLAGPILLGTASSVVIYFLHDHRELEYDDCGYRERRGKKDLAPHQWSEFKECSIIKDSYGRQKVRAYFERDGPHYDIDSSACGIDPYTFRDFVSSRINSHTPEEHPPDLIRGLEREFQDGRARFLADLSETFRDYQLSGEVFPLLARGGTRPKGFLLSRFVAFTIMPNYKVCMYAHWLDGSHAREKVMRLLRVVETQRDQNDIKWSWLLLLSDEPAPESVNKLIGDFGNKDVGLGYVNISTGEIRTSPNQLGRSMANQMRLNRLILDLRRRKYLAY